MPVLPKIHKLDPMVLNKITNNFDSIGIITPSGRPLISQIGTVTESIGRVVDSQLVSIVQSHSTYLKDTTDLILKLENLRPPSECLLCSFDISQMFTNCPIDEIMPAVKKAFDNFDKSQFKIKSLPTDDLIYLLESILRNNVFEFNNILWKQQIGAAIGAIPSPQITEYERKFLDNFDTQDKIKHMRGQIHYISNKKPLEKEIKNLKRHISQIANEMNYYTETLPIKWIQLEQALILLKDTKEPSKRSYEKWENIDKIAQTYSIKEEELLRFLNYQHRIGNYIFFEDKRDYIILQPDWLIECFRCLVCDNEKITSGSMVSELSNLKKFGKLSKDLIEQLFCKGELLKFKECQTHILNVMEKFDIIVKTDLIDSYYMPCMIKNSSTLEQIKEQFRIEDFNCKPWLVLEFEFLPIAIFNHILVYYIRQYPVCEIPSFDKKSHPAIYTGKAVVHLDNTNCRRLIICFSRNVIALQIWNLDDIDIEDIMYEDILSKLCSYMEKLETTLKNNLSYQIKAKCSTGNYLSMSDRYSFEQFQKKCGKKGKYYCDEHATIHRERFKEYLAKICS
ncbi:unnamed protein product [Mytilus edulis]|uniref:COR domain-containing protein n=1 Tax=Mytilus edulis TaxID=6550 RepID=A0A8S3V742_MYTED|nr:unnamed protein product [Mytilus edulis]